MERILTAKEMREADRTTIEKGIPSLVLMERAALGVVDVMIREEMDLSAAVVVCGTGNNGGDGIAVARMLFERGFRPQILAAGDPEKYSPDRKRQEDILRTFYPADIRYDPEKIRWNEKTVIVDALFGIGLSRPIRGDDLDLVKMINGSGVPVVAVDIPSGVHTDTGKEMGLAVRAAHTVTFTAYKAGLFLGRGRECSGCVHKHEIGIPVLPEEKNERIRYRITEADLDRIPVRDRSGNKGTFGKILVIAGSRTICGAAYLAGKACLRSGAGMVRIYTEEANRIPLAASFPEALLDTYSEENWSPEILDPAIAWADAILIGPGIGTETTAERILAHVLKSASLPLILDADALNLLRGRPEILKDYPGSCTVTPHIMEMSRLTGAETGTIKDNAVGAAEDTAERSGACVVLKDASTVIAQPGGPSWIFADGSSALATAGSGDVLAGITAALTARMPGRSAEAGALAVCIHGMCGIQAEHARGADAVTAGDLTDHIRL